jgi:hypothetical protein
MYVIIFLEGTQKTSLRYTDFYLGFRMAKNNFGLIETGHPVTLEN